MKLSRLGCFAISVLYFMAGNAIGAVSLQIASAIFFGLSLVMVDDKD